MEALAEHFGTAAEFDDPAGGIFLWVKLPGRGRHHEAAIRPRPPPASPSIPGRNGRSNKDYGRSRMRLCFASPSHEEISAGVAVLAEVCHREFGVPLRSANVQQGGT